jgi:hypothetical protein
MRIYEGLEVQLHPFFTLALAGGEYLSVGLYEML